MYFHFLFYRYAIANHAGVDDHNPNSPNTHLIYLDANNLNGWAMSQHLPTSNFQWLKPEQIESLDINSITEDNERGYILEVDLGIVIFLS